MEPVLLKACQWVGIVRTMKLHRMDEKFFGSSFKCLKLKYRTKKVSTVWLVEKQIQWLINRGIIYFTNKWIIYCIVGNFRETEIFVIFAIKHQLAKISSSKNFMLTTSWGSQAHYHRATDSVTQQRIDTFCRRNVEQTAEIFYNLQSTCHRNCKWILIFSSQALGRQFFINDPHASISNHFDVETHAQFRGRIAITCVKM